MNVFVSLKATKNQKKREKREEKRRIILAYNISKVAFRVNDSGQIIVFAFVILYLDSATMVFLVCLYASVIGGGRARREE